MSFAIIMPIVVYASFLLTSLMSPFYTQFVAPRGLWKLVPFRVGGWRSIFEHNKIYKANWVWSKLDFSNFYLEEKK